MNKTNGFTLIEVMMASSLMSIVMAGAVSVNLSSIRLWNETGANVTASLKSSTVIGRVVGGIGDAPGLRSACTIAVLCDESGWVAHYETPSPEGNVRYVMQFLAGAQIIRLAKDDGLNAWVTIGREVASSTLTVDRAQANVTVTLQHRQGRADARNSLRTGVRIRNA